MLTVRFTSAAKSSQIATCVKPILLRQLGSLPVATQIIKTIKTMETIETIKTIKTYREQSTMGIDARPQITEHLQTTEIFTSLEISQE